MPSSDTGRAKQTAASPSGATPPAVSAVNPATPDQGALGAIGHFYGKVCAGLRGVPESAIALLGRFALAATFWKSGQTKVQGLEIDLVEGVFRLGWPRLSDSAVALFQDEYRLPWLDPYWAASLAAVGEHALPLLLLLGLGTRVAALGLLVMTAVIQFGVYPGAYPTHGVWAAVALWLMVRGPGAASLDRLLRLDTRP